MAVHLEGFFILLFSKCVMVCDQQLIGLVAMPWCGRGSEYDIVSVLGCDLAYSPFLSIFSVSTCSIAKNARPF